VLGKGALSTVALCTCTRSGLHVALKIYPKSSLSAASLREVLAAWAAWCLARCSARSLLPVKRSTPVGGRFAWRR
jgi:hypothetical protein